MPTYKLGNLGISGNSEIFKQTTPSTIGARWAHAIQDLPPCHLGFLETFLPGFFRPKELLPAEPFGFRGVASSPKPRTFDKGIFVGNQEKQPSKKSPTVGPSWKVKFGIPELKKGSQSWWQLLGEGVLQHISTHPILAGSLT